MTTTTATWPTAAELERAETLLDDTSEVLDELQLVARSAACEITNNSEGPGHPTLEEIGKMSWFIESAEMHIDQMQEQLNAVRSARNTAALFAPMTELVQG